MTPAEPRVRRGPVDPPDNSSWRRRAACRDSDPELFFPHVSGRLPDDGVHPAVRKATDICATCPVTAECEAFAVAIPGVYGIWAGRTEDELRAERRRRLRRTTAGGSS